MTLTTEELGRLRVSLAALDGFDPVGLRPPFGGVVVDRAPPAHGGPDVLRFWQPDVNYLQLWHEPALDLADPATADRVARWLAARVGLEVRPESACIAPSWRIPFQGCSLRRWLLGPSAAVFCAERDYADRRSGWTAVPALADLDPTDDRRLPDGSRYVDRLALALVAVAVGAP